MKRATILISCGLLLSLQGCNQAAKENQVSTTYNARIYKTDKSDFGYDIYQDSTLIIHQPIIPGVAGNAGFVSGEDAQKVADLVIDKLDKGVMPPSVTPRELDSLNIRRN